MRQAMIEYSGRKTDRLIRSFMSLGPGRTFAQMPAALGTRSYFGAKLVSVFADPAHMGGKRHRGVVALFHSDTGEVLALADAEVITLIRTAAASAIATDALARENARNLAILGTGAQAEAHARALCLVRPFKKLSLWGRNIEKCKALAARLSGLRYQSISIASAPEHAVQDADVICTVTGAQEPVLLGRHIDQGAHVNLVGSSGPGPREADSSLLAKSRYFGDCRDHILLHGAELLHAIDEGVADESCFLAEIGEVLSGKHVGRRSPEDITIYKSLGHAVQDLAAAAYIYEKYCNNKTNNERR